jgi:hypothetical protein
LLFLLLLHQNEVNYMEESGRGLIYGTLPAFAWTEENRDKFQSE